MITSSTSDRSASDADGCFYLVHTSALMLAILNQSLAAKVWFNRSMSQQLPLIGSRWLATEARRIGCNEMLRGNDVDIGAIEEMLAAIDLSPVDDRLLAEAETLPVLVRSGDALHLATARRLAKSGPVVVVTHDRQMAEAAKTLGLGVVDPVTDDPGRTPVG